MPRTMSLAGKRFGSLTVIKRIANDSNGKTMWLCRCDCGVEKPVRGSQLVNGASKSCGCMKKEFLRIAKTTNGLKHSKVRVKWRNMMNRCYDSNNHEYKNYGGRGISVCDEWHSLDVFAKWAYSNGYAEGSQLTIDRVDVNGNYSPDNCRFVSMKTQCNNKTNNHFLVVDGITKTLAEWESVSGVSQRLIRYRIEHGWGAKDAVYREANGERYKNSRDSNQ